jgi:hypothetical protein
MITLRASPASPASTKATHPTKLLVNDLYHQNAMALVSKGRHSIQA